MPSGLRVASYVFTFFAGVVFFFLFLLWARNDFHVQGMVVDTSTHYYDCDSRYRTQAQIDGNPSCGK